MSGEDKERESVLTDDEKALLLGVRAAADENMDFSVGGLLTLPIGVEKRLLEELNLDDNVQNRIRAGDVYYHPLTLLTSVIEEEYGCLYLNAPKQIGVLSQWLGEEFLLSGAHAQSGAFMGAALVLKAVHLIYGASFIDGFGKIDIDCIKGTLRDESRDPRRRASVENLVVDCKIPAYQVGLNRIVNKMAACLNLEPQLAFREAASVTYRMLERNLPI